MSLLFGKGPGRIINDVEMEVGTFDNISRDEFA
jgi:hypothetical protein